jgi:tRNA A-37 threonylcarbamoyl transferase component Bud32
MKGRGWGESLTEDKSAGSAILPGVSEHELEQALRDLPRIGALVKDRGYRQVWRFSHQDQAYYLKFYPRVAPLKRLFRGSPALREFFRLQWLQKARIPAPRAVATLSGFRLNNQLGDAVILEAIEPAVTLDVYLNNLQWEGEAIADHLHLAQQVRTLVYQLGRAGFGHSDLHLGNFLLKDQRLFLLDAYAVQSGGLKLDHVLQLGHSVRGLATRTDLQRGWELLGSGSAMPKKNPVSRRWWRVGERRSTGENRYFGRLKLDGWSGHYFKQFKYPRRGFAASRLQITEKDWSDAWPRLMGQIESGQLEVLKRTASGEVLGGEIVLGGHPVGIIVKRPRRKLWYRYINEIGRGSRARRAWKKSWSLIVRGIPTAWPLLLMERRVMGYVVDQVIVFERVAGPTLERVNLDDLPPLQRDRLLRRCGRLLRQLEADGLYHYDAKASIWIVRPDEKLGPSPVLIDVDGIRRVPWVALGIERLLRSMKSHPEYTPEDSLALCQGYAPGSRVQREEEESETRNPNDE